MNAISTGPVDAVWRLLLDARTWPSWTPIDELLPDRSSGLGVDHGGTGVGSVRAFRTGDVVSAERVTELVEHRRLSYEDAVNDALHDYRASVELTPTPDGTAIRWHGAYVAAPGLETVLPDFLRTFMQRMVDGLAARAGWGPDLSGVRAPEPLVARYRGRGLWRTTSVVDDLERRAAATPAATALVGIAADATERTLSYAELAATVERYAAGLHGLGIGAGDVVSLWLPSRWELAALVLACWRIGAVASPMMASFGVREVERMAARVGSPVFVTVDTAAGVDHGAALAAMAPRLPALRHQVVLGEPGEGQRALADCVAGGGTAPTAADPDAAALVLFTSGTTGEPKAVVHSLNTVTSGLDAYLEDDPLDTGAVVHTPHPLAHAAGLFHLLLTLRSGAALVVAEEWDPEAAVRLVDRWAVTVVKAAPVFLQQLLDVAGPGTLTSLQRVTVIAATPSRHLVDEVARRCGTPLRSYWAMTEVNGIHTRPDEPPDVAAHSIGRPTRGLEVDLRTDGRLFVRGPGVCLAVAGRDGAPVRRVVDHDDGWYDTGDLAAPDGRGGYALLGRAADRIRCAGPMIPTSDVEDALREHPAIADAALVETRDDDRVVPCAVVVPAPGTPAPTLDEARSFLLDRGMTASFLPQRLEVLDALPRTALGKVRKVVLRDRYAASSGCQDPARSASSWRNRGSRPAP